MMDRLYKLHFSSKGFVIWLVGTLIAAVLFGMMAALPPVLLVFNWGVPALAAVLLVSAVWALASRPKIGDWLLGLCKGAVAALQTYFTYTTLVWALAVCGASEPVGANWAAILLMAAVAAWCTAAELTGAPKGSVSERVRVNYLSAGLFLVILTGIALVEGRL